MKILVLGAGISGLTAAYRLKQAGSHVTLLEQSKRAGGWIRTVKRNGFLFELGPRSCRPHGDGQATLTLARELGLEPIWAPSEAHRRYLYYQGKLRRLFPPPSLWPTIWRERRIPRTTLDDESIHDFFARRFSRAFANRYADVMTAGVYAGSSHELSMRSCFPRLWELAQRHGSLIKGMWRSRKPRQRAALFTFRDGMESLPRALEEQLSGHIHFETPVTQIELCPDGVTVHSNDQIFEGDHLISTLPSSALAPLLPSIPCIPSASVVTVSLGYHTRQLRKRGFGYLIPSSEQEESLGVVWDSCVFPQQNQSPNETRLTVMLRGLKDDVELLEIAKQTASQHLGVDAEPDASDVSIAYNAIPQYRLGHHRLVETAQENLADLPITLLGSSFVGVSVNALIASSLSLPSIVSHNT